MYGIFTYIFPQNGPNVGKYSIHGASGYVFDTQRAASRFAFRGQDGWPESRPGVGWRGMGFAIWELMGNPRNF